MHSQVTDDGYLIYPDGRRVKIVPLVYPNGDNLQLRRYHPHGNTSRELISYELSITQAYVKSLQLSQANQQLESLATYLRLFPQYKDLHAQYNLVHRLAHSTYLMLQDIHTLFTNVAIESTGDYEFSLYRNKALIGEIEYEGTQTGKADRKRVKRYIDSPKPRQGD